MLAEIVRDDGMGEVYYGYHAGRILNTELRLCIFSGVSAMHIMS
jgi:hypothetical protein